MIVIPVRVCGDAWSNGDEVKALLEQTSNNTTIQLDFYHEGVSLQAIGLLQILDQYCASTGRDPATISLIRNPNHAEKTAYKNFSNIRNHCLGIVKNYWQEAPVPDQDARVFAYFLGRRTIARSYILYDLWHSMADSFLFSSMHNRGPEPWVRSPQGINLETVSDWMNSETFDSFCSWFQSCPVSSIDGHAVSDHYDSNQNIHRDLLLHYNKFQIELIAETYTMGNTFFPTEKTFRPIMAAKPFVIYGPKNFLSRLREMGFETYSTCWDENYDQLEGPARWHAIKQVLADIKISDVDWQIAHRNRQHLRKLVYDH
jgi:hypothetical protein